jgi:hypothetical protein
MTFHLMKSSEKGWAFTIALLNVTNNFLSRLSLSVTKERIVWIYSPSTYREIFFHKTTRNHNTSVQKTWSFTLKRYFVTRVFLNFCHVCHGCDILWISYFLSYREISSHKTTQDHKKSSGKRQSLSTKWFFVTREFLNTVTDVTKDAVTRLLSTLYVI